LVAATLVGLMSLPGIAVLYAGLVQRKWVVNTTLTAFTGFSLVLVVCPARSSRSTTTARAFRRPNASGSSTGSSASTTAVPVPTAAPASACPIAREIVAAHGGTVTVADTDAGATFRITLPTR
jgi:hypothetical protein